MKAIVTSNYQDEFGQDRVEVRIGHTEYGIDLYRHPEAINLRKGQRIEAFLYGNSPFAYLVPKPFPFKRS